MKKRNTIFMAGLLILGLLASCKKDNNTDQNLVGTDLLRANIEQLTDNGSRTHIEVNGNEGYVRWNEGDQFLVVDANGDAYTFTLNSGQSGETEPIFRSSGSENMTNPFAAVYPATNSIEGATATITLPATQAYAEGTFANGTNVMVGYQAGSEREVDFKNVLGGLCFPLVGNMTVTSVVLTSNNTNDHLSGTFTVDCNSDTPELTYVSDGGNSITIDCGEGVLLSSTPIDFYIMVPPGTLESGFSVRAYNGTTMLFEQSTQTAPGTNFLTRNVIRKMTGSLEVVVETLTVTTVSPTFITKNSAKGIGSVSGGTPTACGILYIKADDVTGTLADQLKIGGTNVEQRAVTTPSMIFDIDLTGLDMNTVYYVRAYAVNSVGIVTYGDDIIPFATRREYFTGPNAGKMTDANGNVYQFSVSATTKVGFSMGNLQYIGSAGNGDANNTGAYWKFAEKQFDFLGNTTGQLSTSATVDRDLFGWGTSGYNNGAVCYQPWSTSSNDNDYYSHHLYYETGQADWGYNAISNGGNITGQWRTLTGATGGEWAYLLNTRSATYRYAVVNLKFNGTSNQQISLTNGIYACGTSAYGMIVFPDGFSWPTEYVNELDVINSGIHSGDNNHYFTEAQWSLLEQVGAVFLPSAGWREGITSIAGGQGFYWSSVCSYMLYYFPNDINPQRSTVKHYGGSVRLVCDLE